jgi:hypothetical protein
MTSPAPEVDDFAEYLRQPCPECAKTLPTPADLAEHVVEVHGHPLA